MYRVPFNFVIDLLADGLSNTVDIDLARIPIGWKLAGGTPAAPLEFRPKMLFPDGVYSVWAQGFTLLTASVDNGILHLQFSGSAPAPGQEIPVSGNFTYNVI